MAGRSIKLKGKEFTLDGPQLKVGDTAPVATLRKDLTSDISLSEYSGKTRIYSVVPSLDTPVCAQQTKRFNEDASKYSDTLLITISCDLPVAQKRFSGAEGIDLNRITFLSDHKDTEFGKKFGALLPELRILCRAVFVIDAEDKLRYVEYVPEMSELPNYDAILKCVGTLS